MWLCQLLCDTFYILSVLLGVIGWRASWPLKTIFKLIYLFFESRLFNYKEMRYGAYYMDEPCKQVSESNKI